MPALSHADRRTLDGQAITHSDRRARAAFHLLLAGWPAEQVQEARALALIQGAPDSARAAVSALLAATPPDADYPLSHFTDRPLSRRGLVKLLDRWGRRAGVGAVTLRRITLTRIVMRMEDGADAAQIAEDLGVSVEAVALRMRRNGLRVEVSPSAHRRLEPPVYRVPLGSIARW